MTGHEVAMLALISLPFALGVTVDELIGKAG